MRLAEVRAQLQRALEEALRVAVHLPFQVDEPQVVPRVEDGLSVRGGVGDAREVFGVSDLVSA
ncbi:MAG: hypothetical protein K6T35_11455 [Meiothermus silvanus]|nr:hypothetical protein [Allomeiothermus silvanus]